MKRSETGRKRCSASRHAIAIASERVALLLGAGQGRQLEGNNNRQGRAGLGGWMDELTSRKGRKKDMHGLAIGMGSDRSGAATSESTR